MKDKVKIVEKPVFKKVEVSTFWREFLSNVFLLLIISITLSFFITTLLFIGYSVYTHTYYSHPFTTYWMMVFWGVNYFVLLIWVSLVCADEEKESHEEEIRVGYVKEVVKGGKK